MIGTIEENKRIRGILMKREKAELSDALMQLADKSPSAHMLVMSLASTTHEKIALFKQNIHAITHQGRRSSLSGEQILDMLHRSLELLDPEVMDPKEGLTLMASFYETDSWAVESTTELDFDFELLFTDAGFEKFTDFATRCPDPDFVIQTVKHLLLDDGYCMRTMLLDEASTYLSEDGVKALRA